MELSNGVATALNLQLPGTLVFDYPSVSAMAAHVHSLMAPAGALVPAHVTASSLVTSPLDAHPSQLLAKVRSLVNPARIVVWSAHLPSHHILFLPGGKVGLQTSSSSICFAIQAGESCAVECRVYDFVRRIDRMQRHCRARKKMQRA